MNELKAVILAVLVVLAGCSTTGDKPQSPMQEEAETEVVTEAPEQTSSQSTISTQKPPTQEINGVIYYNMTPRKTENVRSVMSGFYSRLPENQSDRLNITSSVAETTCERSAKIDLTALNASSESKRQLYRVKHAAKSMSAFNDKIKPSKIDTAISTASTAAQYTTVAGSYNEYYEAACAFDRDNPETVEDFYIASAALGVELAMMQYGVYYKVSSKTVRVASHTRTFRMVQAKFGDDALRIFMSEAHWAIRGQVNGVNRFIAEQAKKSNLDLNSSELNQSAFRKRLNRTERLSENGTIETGINHTKDVVNKTSDSLIKLFEESSVDEKVECLSKLDGSLFGYVSNLVKEVANGENVTREDLQKLSDKNKDKLRSCLKKNS